MFGRVKGAYGSDVGARSYDGARVWVWGMWVLWNMVGLVQVGGEAVVFCVFGWVSRIFEHPHTPLTKVTWIWYNEGCQYMASKTFCVLHKRLSQGRIGGINDAGKQK